MSAVPDVPELPRPRLAAEQSTFTAIADRWRFPLAVYLASRVLYLLVAIADIFIRNEALGRELRNWDGKWYVLLGQYGYPHTLPTTYGAKGWSTLGFEPLYSMLMWVGGQVSPNGVEPAGLLVSLVGGAVATVEISVLAERWWGREASRRGVLFFCFFPGTIVFSMVYSEGLTLALIAGAMLCLDDRRWIAAGLLAGAAPAVEPVAFAIIPAFGVVFLRELWRNGWRDREAWRSAWAPVLSVWGAAGVGLFMWFWTGTPTAVFRTQRIAWGEKSSPYAVWYQIHNFVVNEIFGHNQINLNLPAGILGAGFMLWGMWWLWKLRKGLALEGFGDGISDAALLQGRGVPLAVLVYTFFVFLETFTSDNTPPNPRMLVCAFPLLFAFAAPRTGRKQKWTLAITVVLLIAMSIGTFAGGGLRP
jgi:hypothetical protein